MKKQTFRRVTQTGAKLLFSTLALLLVLTGCNVPTPTPPEPETTGTEQPTESPTTIPAPTGSDPVSYTFNSFEELCDFYKTFRETNQFDMLTVDPSKINCTNWNGNFSALCFALGAFQNFGFKIQFQMQFPDDDAVYNLFLYREQSMNEKIPSENFKSLLEIEKHEAMRPEEGFPYFLKIGEEIYLVCVLLDELSESDQIKVVQAVIDALVVLD